MGIEFVIRSPGTGEERSHMSYLKVAEFIFVVAVIFGLVLLALKKANVNVPVVPATIASPVITP